MNRRLERIYNRSRDLFFPAFLNEYWKRKLHGSVICLLYHRVDDCRNNSFLTIGGSPVISVAEFEKDLKFLKKMGAMFLTFRDFREGIFPDSSEFGVIITFDDCFLDNYTQGLEVMENIGVKGVFFQTTSIVEGRELLWEHLLYWLWANYRGHFEETVSKMLPQQPLNARNLISYLRNEAPLSFTLELLSRSKEFLRVEDQSFEAAQKIYPKSFHLKQADSLGHEIGSHGHHHYSRSKLDSQAFETELKLSAQKLADILGPGSRAFSYPFNDYTDRDALICSRYFCQAATVDSQRIHPKTDCMRIPRFTWPGPARNQFRARRWLLTGRI